MGTGETTNMEVTSNTSSPWELISETDVTAVTELDLSWDGSLYNEVHLYLDDVQPQTDNVSLRLRVGSDDGATIHTTSKYDGVTNTYINLSIGAQNNDYLLLSGLVGNNALDAGVYGKINVFGFGASADGALIESQLGWEDGSGSGGAYWTKGVAFNIEEHIDTIRLYWSSGDFAANGKAYLYGLKKSP